MRTYLIYFNEGNTNSERIINHIKSFKRHSQISPNVWLLMSNEDKATSVRDIFNNLDDNKPLIIIDVTYCAWASIKVDNVSMNLLNSRQNNFID